MSVVRTSNMNTHQIKYEYEPTQACSLINTIIEKYKLN